MEEYLKVMATTEETESFARLSEEKEKDVHSHVKPKYDDGCIFMYQIL